MPLLIQQVTLHPVCYVYGKYLTALLYAAIVNVYED
jgi:hypothetical protein